ncbi:MAG: guanylate kinase [Pseudomonadota bacterium]
MSEGQTKAERAEFERRGLMLVLSSPSGAGKSTLARNLLDSDPDISLSISATTRPRRGSEIDGVHYNFVSETEFKRMTESDALLEFAHVHGNYYGTPRDPAERAMDEGRDILLDIDYQGALQVFERARGNVVSIFILPPSMDELRKRLVRRAEDSDEVIEKRLANSRIEMAAWDNYDYVIVNRDLSKAFEEVRSILTAERLRRERRPSLFSFVEELQKTKA